jgi:hypothetical protein
MRHVTALISSRSEAEREGVMSEGIMVAAVALAALLVSGLTSTAAAQTNGAPVEDPIEITTGLLERLAAVYPVVSAIAADAEPRIAAAETEAVARAIQETTEDQIIAVLEEVELTAAEYVSAIRRLNADPALRDRFVRMLAAAEAGAPS